MKATSDMTARRFLKACRWFFSAPHRRLKHLSSKMHWRAAQGLHWTAELSGGGFPDISANVIVGRHSRLGVPVEKTLRIEEGAWIGDDCDISAGEWIVIGSYTSLQHRSQILGDVQIGSGCVCAPNLYISSGWHHFMDRPCLPIRVQDQQAQRDVSRPRSRPVRIGDDCWFGINVVVMPGVTIGRGCVIGANSVVTKNVAPYSVIAGSPAKLIRERLEFCPPQTLNASLEEHLPYFYSGFRQWTAESDNVEKHFIGGGRPARKHFKIALETCLGMQVTLQIRSFEAGQLMHGGAYVSVCAGISSPVFSACPDTEQLLCFEWIGADRDIEYPLMVISVSSSNFSNDSAA